MMLMNKPLTETMSVSSQIGPAEVASLKELGFGMLINNRPDGEVEGQPTSEEMHEAAQAAGLKYAHVPIGRGISPGDVEKMQAALEAASGDKIIAFCRSGTRSTLVWAVAKAEQGTPRAELEQAAQGAGYSLTPVLA